MEGKKAEAEMWTTVEDPRKTTVGNGSAAEVPRGRMKAPKQSARKRSPTRSPSRGTKTPNQPKGAETRLSDVDQGDGKVVFKQLRNYLNNDAPSEYVWDTVVRLNEKAQARRFQGYWAREVQQCGDHLTEEQAKAEWKDLMPDTLRATYESLTSYWTRGKEEHRRRLQVLMKTWILEESCKQKELETRLRFFTFVTEDAVSTETEDKAAAPLQRSYLNAVAAGSMNGQIDMAGDLSKFYEICVKPMEPLEIPRPCTTEEERALLLILNHELEVPFPPKFLVQTMTGAEMARFIDIFKSIEYPLYAHLMPGQRFGEHMSKQAILNQIHMGAEAAPSQKQAILDFKRDISRITLDVNTRVLTVTFKGKTTAQKWAGWQLSLAMKLLPLIDYEKQRETAKLTRAIVALDYYTLTADLRKGALTSADMHWLLSNKLGLEVHTIAHIETKGAGMNDKQWRISIRAPACPMLLRKTGFIHIGEVEILIHHDRVYNHWPCMRCGSPGHPAKYCKVAGKELEATRATHTCIATDQLPSESVESKEDKRLRTIPKTMQELKVMLQGHTDASRKHGSTSRSRSKQRSSRASPVRTTTQKLVEWSGLPSECEQHRQPAESCTQPMSVQEASSAPTGGLVSDERSYIARIMTETLTWNSARTWRRRRMAATGASIPRTG